MIQSGAGEAQCRNAAVVIDWVIQGLVVCVEARELRGDLARAIRSVETLKAENNRLQGLLKHLSPALPTRMAPPDGSHEEQIVGAALDYLHKNLGRCVHLSDIAAALRMNPCYLSSVFSRTLGVSFHAYFDHLRIAKAVELLRDPSKRVSEVAYAVGYASAGQFWWAFKAKTGLSPRAWRSSATP